MSTVAAFAPARSRRIQRELAPVVPIDRGRRAAGAGRVPAAPLRLTRRGRVVASVLAAIVVAIILGAGVALLGHQALAGETTQPITASYRVVMPGETLWSIAGEIAPHSDRRDTIDRIVEFNALSTPGLQTGQRIAIPSDLAEPSGA
jgi:LysM domain